MKKRLVPILLFIFSLEVLLRLSGITNTFNEKNNGQYDYLFVNDNPTWFYTWQPHSTVEFGNNEFTYLHHYNELGHRENSYEDFKHDSNSLKIVSLGDSFTEGDGASYDSTWLRIFEYNLEQAMDTPVVCYNAGVCGSDVLYNAKTLEENILHTSTDIVLECVNNSDLTDIYYRGSKARFNPDGSMNSPNYKWWEPIYKYSRFIRAAIILFSDYDRNLINTKTVKEDEQKSMEIMAEQIIESYQKCREKGMDYYLIIHPVPHDAMYDDMHDFQEIIKLLPEEIPVINLFPVLLSFFDKHDVRNYYWEKNGHYNNQGYTIMGEHIFKEFIQSYNGLP
jgi:hypothetical protein